MKRSLFLPTGNPHTYTIKHARDPDGGDECGALISWSEGHVWVPWEPSIALIEGAAASFWEEFVQMWVYRSSRDDSLAYDYDYMRIRGAWFVVGTKLIVDPRGWCCHREPRDWARDLREAHKQQAVLVDVARAQGRANETRDVIKAIEAMGPWAPDSGVALVLGRLRTRLARAT